MPMSEREPIRTRWRDADPHTELPAQLFRQLSRPGLGPAQLADVRARIEETLAPGAPPQRWLSRAARHAGVRGVALLLCAGAVLVLGLLLRSALRGPTAPAPPVAPVPAVSAPAPVLPAGPAPSPRPTPLAPAPPAPGPVRPRPARPLPKQESTPPGRRAEPPAAPEPPATPAAEAPPATSAAPAAATPAAAPAEFQLVSAAVQKLRREHAPDAALRVLDTYDREFPHGELQPEAEWLRVQALVLLAKRREALARLDRQALTLEAEGSAEPLLLRGQLRSEAGRCSEALPDLDAAAALGSGEFLERALLYRGQCRSRTGDVPGARADFSVYLVRFPTGRYREAIRKALRDLPPE